MDSATLNRFTLAIGVAAMSLSACGSSEPPIGAHAMPYGAAETSSPFQVLHRFDPEGSGVQPRAALLDVSGTLYGTTFYWHVCRRNYCGDGGIFSINSRGAEKRLHRFSGLSDGSHPDAPLIDVDGTLYGTTRRGGDSYCGAVYGCGTVFSIDSSGSEKVLYAFKGGSDGAFPTGGLVDVDGTLYGTTVAGGGGKCKSNYTGGCGTVYSITPTGTETVLYAFKGIPDGAGPQGSLTDVNGTLYGTTTSGGVTCDAGSASYASGCGVVFAVTTAGSESVLHRFKNQADGAFPAGGLLDVRGTLYGATGTLNWIGSSVLSPGTIYKIATDGKLKTLYDFQGTPDGAVPAGGLIYANGLLYGTTVAGGAACTSAPKLGCGTIFNVTKDGKESVLYRFAGGSDGFQPMAGLTYSKGRLYGTTLQGGLGRFGGAGTVFALSPSPER